MSGFCTGEAIASRKLEVEGIAAFPESESLSTAGSMAPAGKCSLLQLEAKTLVTMKIMGPRATISRISRSNHTQGSSHSNPTYEHICLD